MLETYCLFIGQQSFVRNMEIQERKQTLLGMKNSMFPPWNLVRDSHKGVAIYEMRVMNQVGHYIDKFRSKQK